MICSISKQSLFSYQVQIPQQCILKHAIHIKVRQKVKNKWGYKEIKVEGKKLDKRDIIMNSKTHQTNGMLKTGQQTARMFSKKSWVQPTVTLYFGISLNRSRCKLQNSFIFCFFPMVTKSVVMKVLFSVTDAFGVFALFIC